MVLESTVYPGVTNQSWRPLIEKYGLSEGKEVDIAYCPERFNPGDEQRTVRKVARVVGCNDEFIGNGLVRFYQHLTSEDVRYVGKLEVAEAAKVIENVQRDINIALVNELARIFPAMDVDVEDVLSAAATKWNFHRYTPGVGVGGHCIPVDPYYMIQRASDVGVPAGLITAARAVNRSMPNHVAQVLVDILWKAGLSADSTKVLFLGWSYKAEVGDPRETPAEPLAEALQQRGINVSVFDPHIDPKTFPESVEVITDLSQAKGHHLAVLVWRTKPVLTWTGLPSHRTWRRRASTTVAACSTWNHWRNRVGVLCRWPSALPVNRFIRSFLPVVGDGLLRNVKLQWVLIIIGRCNIRIPLRCPPDSLR